ncbi:hypothetical protein ABPG75_012981 [Micractinium tetrahymenae]
MAASCRSGSPCTTPRRSRQRQTGGPLTSEACPTAMWPQATSTRGCPPLLCAWSVSCTPTTSTARGWAQKAGTTAGPSPCTSAPRCGWKTCGGSSGTRAASSPPCSGCRTRARTWKMRSARWSSTALHTGTPSSLTGPSRSENTDQGCGCTLGGGGGSAPLTWPQLDVIKWKLLAVAVSTCSFAASFIGLLRCKLGACTQPIMSGAAPLGLGLALPQRSLCTLSTGQRMQRLLATGAQRRPLARAPCLRVAAAGKGFAKAAQQQQKKTEEDAPAVPGQREDRVKAVKFKGKRSMRGGPQSQAAQQYARGAAEAAQPGFNVLGGAPDDSPREDLVEAIEFEQRLKQLKAESEARKAEAAAAAAAGGGVLDAGRRQQEEDIYANVQPLSKSLLGSQDDSGAAKEYEGAQFGPSQAGLAVAAVLLGAVFLLTSGGADFAPDSRPAATLQQAGAAPALGEEQRAEVEAQLAEVQAKLAADGDDLQSLEAAAVLNARLGKFADAEQQLSKLAAARPGDAEVLRVLAEAQAAQAKWGAAAGSYRKAWEAGGRGSLEVLQGLAGVLVADGKEAAAVQAVQAARAEGGSSGVGDAELALLLAKTYAQWRGHVPDALAVYDLLIESRPDDFRAYLAKGLLLKEQGREGDAQRYFIQAKYYAKENKQLVESIISARQQAGQ